MKREPVVSSNIASIGYDENNNILEVEFNNGNVYEYYDVPLYEYEGLMSADSKGTYLNANIKKGGYRYSKL